ncbi:hypothetical protein BOX15_Mlig023980g2 [Macrostomum lignano]|uniref:Replication protein A OB domain-containing protein n=1 Tax=Macrostomum lignano TaxID=282301 RepID=A0A267EDG2_9PLAT|nr:hypothetical protein BOX15_Mlig023980g2 [Macrostomum lignano]
MLKDGKQAKQVSLSVGPMRGVVSGITSLRTEIRDGKKNKWFSFLMSDESGEIRVAVFGDELQEHWSICENGQTISIREGMVKCANPKFNRTSNMHEVTLSINEDNKDSLRQCSDAIVPINGPFKALSELPRIGVNGFVDVLGVIVKVEQPVDVNTRSGKLVQLAKVCIVDKSGFQTFCNFWDALATQVHLWRPGDVVAIRKAKIQEYAGSLCLGCSSSTISYSPVHDTAQDLKTWYEESEFPNFYR